MEPDFLNNLGGSSLDRVELVMAFEEAGNTELSDEEMEEIHSFRTVQEVLDYLRSRGKGRH